MKRSNKILTIIMLLILMIVVSLAAFAQDKQAAFRELREKMSALRDSEIYPAMTNWKSQLDNAMSKEDLAKLNELRGKAALLRSQVRSKMADNRKMMMDGKRMPRHERKAGMDRYRDDFGGIMAELKSLAEKYKTTLEAIVKEAKPKVAEWKKQGQEIMKNWRSENAGMIDSSRFGMHSPGRFFGRKMNFNSKRAIAFFMLWDGKKMEFPGRIEGNTMGNATFMNKIDENLQAGQVKIFPNPFADKTTIAFNMPQEGHAKLTVTDEAGSSVAILFDGILTKGMQSFVFDASKMDGKKLSTGTYFYKLETDNDTQTGKMIRER